ncbi:MAG: zinc ribbon domain-containing protein [Nitrospinae bacterium]|nr:zinc ribbon domain-containing protein [Nitrospinota bacterium]
MLLMVELLILAAALAFIAYPLLKPEAAEPGGGALSENELSALLFKKEAAYAAIKDLEFDRSTGKIDDADYEQMKAQFEAEAIAVLKELSGAGPAEGEKKKRRGGEEVFCVTCGAKVKPNHNFCGKCGAKVERG